jgi:hypothetical protein
MIRIEQQGRTVCFNLTKVVEHPGLSVYSAGYNVNPRNTAPTMMRPMVLPTRRPPWNDRAREREAKESKPCLC